VENINLCIVSKIVSVEEMGIFSKLGGTGSLIVFEIFGGLISPNTYVTIQGN
jgi:hypothetical protein